MKEYLRWRFKVKPERKIVSVVFKGVNVIKAVVVDKEPTQEQMDHLDLKSSMEGRVTWMVKGIYRVGVCGDKIVIEFWNGVTAVAYEPLYLIEKEVAND
jgi:hypothetical protein